MSAKYVGPEFPKTPDGWFSRRYKSPDRHESANEGRGRLLSGNRKRAEAEARQADSRHEDAKAHRLGRCACEAGDR